MKRKIEGSEYSDTDLTYFVCSHLQPILRFLDENGAKYDKGQKLQQDKGGAHSFKLRSKIDFHLVEKAFEIPHFIELSPEYKSIICRRCWCDIEGK